MLLLQLINAALDISAIFEAREDVVSRHTRFTSKASVAALMTGIEAAAARLGATSQQRGPTKCASVLTCMSCLCQLVRFQLPVFYSALLFCLVDLAPDD